MKIAIIRYSKLPLSLFTLLLIGTLAIFFKNFFDIHIAPQLLKPVFDLKAEFDEINEINKSAYESAYATILLESIYNPLSDKMTSIPRADTLSF